MGTTAFMLAVLGSNLFWIGYVIVTIVAVALLMKKFAPRSYKYITTGEVYSIDSPVEYFFVTLLYLVFWPFVAISVILWFIIATISTLVRHGLSLAFKNVEKLTPDIDIKVKKSPSSLEQR